MPITLAHRSSCSFFSSPDGLGATLPPRQHKHKIHSPAGPKGPVARGEVAELESTKGRSKANSAFYRAAESAERLEKDALLESLAGKALKPWTNWPRRSAT